MSSSSTQWSHFHRHVKKESERLHYDMKLIEIVVSTLPLNDATWSPIEMNQILSCPLSRIPIFLWLPELIYSSNDLHVGHN